MYRLVIVLSTLLMVFGSPGVALAQESGEGVITGQVINGTEGGGSVEGLEVALLTYADNALSETRAAGTDSEGKFRFDDVAIEHTYFVTAKYMEVDYYYQVDFESSGTEAYVEVGVCDTTSSDEAVRVGLCHTIIDIGEENLRVTEVIRVLNDSDRTYVGTDGVLVFNLPEDAYSFATPQEMMQDYQFTDDNTVIYLVPFPPGELQLVFAYELARPGSGEFTFPLTVDYPTDVFELLVGGEDFEVSVSRLSPAEPVFTDANERFIHFQGTDIPRNTVMDFSVYSLSGGGGPYIIAVCVIIAILVAGATFYFVRRRKVG